MSKTEGIEIDFNKSVRYLAGFAVLLAILVYFGITSSTLILVAANNNAAMFIYYIGFFALVLSVMGYIINDVDMAKQLFSISIIITAIAMFLYSPTTDSGYYYGSAVLFLLFGVLLYLYFIKYEKSEDVFMRNGFLLISFVIYLLSIMLMGMFGGMDASDFGTYKFWIMGDVYPQSLLLGGTFSAIFAILVIIYAIFQFLGESELITKVSDLIRALLPFVWLLGFLYSISISTTSLLASGYTIPNNLVGVFLRFYMVTNILSLFFAILTVFLVIHVVAEYAIKKE